MLSMRKERFGSDWYGVARNGRHGFVEQVMIAKGWDWRRAEWPGDETQAWIRMVAQVKETYGAVRIGMAGTDRLGPHRLGPARIGKAGMDSVATRGCDSLGQAEQNVAGNAPLGGVCSREAELDPTRLGAHG